jgi:hypothetical protein
MPFAIKQPPESVTNVTLQFALLLRDGFADSDELVGEVVVAGGSMRGVRKGVSGSFLFFGLKPGAQSLLVSSDGQTPYYLSKKVDITLPLPDPPAPIPAYKWLAFPDIRFADPKLPLGDSGQTNAYKQQRVSATLFPTAAYPFPEGTTLIRGTVTHGGSDHPLSGVTVQQSGSNDPPYVSDDHGQFVLYWQDAPGIPQSVNLIAKSAGLADKTVAVTVIRGLGVTTTIDM